MTECEVRGEYLIEERRLAALGPRGLQNTKRQHSLARLHEIGHVVQELVFLLLVLRDQERNWINDGIPLQDESLDVFITLEKEHVEQVLRGQLDVSRLRRLESCRDEVDDFLQR